VSRDREHPRYAHEAAVTFRVNGTAIQSRTRNLSRGGLCALCADPIPFGADVDTDIVLVFDDDIQSEALSIPGRVVWCTPVDDAHQIGIAFRPLDAGKADYLTLFLRYLDDSRTEKQPRHGNVDDRFR